MYNSVQLIKRPDESFPQTLDVFKVIQRPIPQDCTEGHMVLKVLYLGIDPVMRVWLSGAKTYIDSVQLGQVVPSFGLGICVFSRSKKFKKDQIVFGILEWGEYCIVPEGKMFATPKGIDKHFQQLPLLLSVFGVTGLTAVLSLKTIDEASLPTPESPKTLVVSSAAGSTGSLVLQIAKHKGYRVVGIVSGEEKSGFVKGLGADDCICYNQAKDPKTGLIDTNVLTVLIHKKCPNGIDVFYDNAGEEILDAAIANMNTFGNIILCGATATYNQWKTRAGLTNLSSLISKRVKAYGIIYYASRELAYQGFAEMFQLVNDGIVKHQEEYLDGVEQAPFGLQKVFLGNNQGKVIIRVAKDFQKQQEMPKL